jgi:hypothetical protein
VILPPVTAFTVPSALACELADTCGALSVCRQLASANPTVLDTLMPAQATSAKSEFLFERILGHSTFLLGQDGIADLNIFLIFLLPPGEVLMPGKCLTHCKTRTENAFAVSADSLQDCLILGHSWQCDTCKMYVKPAQSIDR